MAENNSFKKIELTEAKNLIKDENPLLFDIRDKNSFDQSHIKSAINLNNHNIDDIVKKTEIKTGIRSKGNLEVVSGLQSGDKIVAEGLGKTRPGAKIKPIINN